jgi:hypothetical protein
MANYPFIIQILSYRWIYNNLCNLCLSPLMLSVWIPFRRGVLNIQHYVKKFVSDFRQVSGFLWEHPVSSTNKTDCHDITKILSKVALNTIIWFIPYSNMTSFFRFVNKQVIYRLCIISLAHAPVHVTDFPVVNIHVDELSSARIWQTLQ